MRTDKPQARKFTDKQRKTNILTMPMEQFNKENSTICDICGESRSYQGGHAKCAKIRKAKYAAYWKEQEEKKNEQEN